MDIQRLTQLQPDVSITDDTEIWDLTSEEAGTAIETLSADTARKILSNLYQQPQTASELAKATDHSIQNVNYHLRNLTDAELIEVADTRYSRKGTEMKIYAPTTNAVLLLSQESTASRIKQLLSRLVSGIGAIAIGAIAFRSLVIGGLSGLPLGSDDEVEDTDDALLAEDEATDLGTERQTTGTEIIRDEITHSLEQLPFFLDPGVVFFTGGVVVLLVFLAISWRRGTY